MFHVLRQVVIPETIYKCFLLLYILSTLPNITQLKSLSEKLGEPGWVFAWREKRFADAAKLPKVLKYGLGINGLTPDADQYDPRTMAGPGELLADYHVDTSKGLEIYTWREAVHQEEIAPIVRGLMESEFFPTATNYFSGVGQAFFSSGIVVYVQPNLNEHGEYTTEKLTLDTKIPPGNASDVVIIIAKEGARLDVTSAIAGADKAVFSRTLVVLCEQDSAVAVTQRTHHLEGAQLLVASRAIAAAHAEVTWRELFAGAGRMKSETESLLVGASARTTIRHALVADGACARDIFVSVKHAAVHTRSTVKAAGAATGTSQTVYRALIDIPRGVKDANGAEEARFLVLAPTAKIDAIPSLDIAAKDVQCSHKLAITHIRPEDIFYPKLRGYSDAESKRMILEGYVGGLFDEDAPQQVAAELAEQLAAITI